MGQIRSFMRITPEDNVPPAVSALFKHNFFVNLIDNAIWMVGDSFSSVATILPVFLSTLTDSPLLIGLIPAIINGGWVLPQLLMANRASRAQSIFKFARKYAVLERTPYLFFPILALLIGRISTTWALLIFFLLITWRGIAAGMVALPWQMVIGEVIPLSHRSRFFGIARLFGQILGVLAAGAAALVLDRIVYPKNYALLFLFTLIAFWLCYVFFAMNRDPKADQRSQADHTPDPAQQHTLASYAAILKQDKNFRNYIISRIFYYLGIMATGFLAVYGIQKFSLSDSQAAVFSGLLLASGVIGYAVWGFLGDRIGPKRIVMVSIGMWIGALLAAVFAASAWVYYMVFVLYGLASAGFILGDLVLVMELGSEEQMAAYMGLARTLPGIFLLLSPILAGWVAGQTSYPFMFGLSIAFSLLFFVSMWGVRDRPRRG